MNFFLYAQTKPRVVATCLCGLLLSGCATGNGLIDPSAAREKREAAAVQQQEGAAQPATEIVRRDMLTPAMTSINNRIVSYGQKLEEWKEVERKSAAQSLPPEKLNRINECKSQLQDILLEYTSLQKQLKQETRVEAAQLLAGNSLLQLNQQDIDYLESGCGNSLAELKAAPAPAAVTAVDPQIKTAFDNADYDQVVSLYAQSTLTPNTVPAVETTFQYGQALLKNHQEAEARKIFTDLLGRLHKQPGQEELLLQVLQVSGDLDFCLGSYEEARKQYEELVRVSIDKGARKEEWAGLQLAALQPGGSAPTEMQAYGTLLKNYLAYTPKRDGYAVAEQAEKFLLAYPASRLVANVNSIHKLSREQADAWLNQGIKRIEAQAGERKALDAQAGGEQQMPGAVPQTAGQAAVSGGQAVAVQTAVIDEKALQDDYDKGMVHLQSKEYDKAIECFNRLLKTPFEEKARPRIEEAAKLGAQEDRQKAADLFVRATTTREPENKKKLLLSSRDLLQNILVKYPQSGLTDKVQRNLSRIEAELRAVDAGAAPRPVSSGGAYVPPKTGTGSPAPSANAL
jgi:tetratricopeptide (TPR) repeat protein